MPHSEFGGKRRSSVLEMSGLRCLSAWAIGHKVWDSGAGLWYGYKIGTCHPLGSRDEITRSEEDQ